MLSTNLALFGILSTASLTLGAASGHTGPSAAGLTERMAAVGAQAKPQEIAYQGCWRRNGQRYCRWYGAPYRGYGYRYYGPTIPEAYPTGSNRWWQEMDREDRGGRGGRR
jgi:hypothetical protein